MSHDAIVLLHIVDLHQPASVELTLSPRVLPVRRKLREKSGNTRSGNTGAPFFTSPTEETLLVFGDVIDRHGLEVGRARFTSLCKS